MADSATYSVVMNREIKVGYEPELVVNAFAELFKITPQEAKTIVGSKRVLKRGVNLKVAETYKNKLGSIGLTVELEKQQPVDVKAEKSIGSKTNSATKVPQIVQPVKQNREAPSISITSNTMVCPKCNHEQAESMQCTYCGVFVHKLQQDETEQNNETAIATRQQQEEQRSDDINSDSTQLKTFLIPMAVALSGAFLWKFIAVTFDYELGLVAWLIGGAIGFSAAMVGAKGQTAGVICAVLVLLSIFGGKYMATASFQTATAEIFASATEYEGVDLQFIYQQQLADAKQFSDTVIDDASLRKFMVDYGYSDYIDAESVSEEEITLFKEYEQPALEDITYTQPGFEEWKETNLAAGIENYSTFDLMVENLGMLDFLFLFLGVGTAFRLASGEQ